MKFAFLSRCAQALCHQWEGSVFRRWRRPAVLEIPRCSLFKPGGSAPFSRCPLPGRSTMSHVFRYLANCTLESYLLLVRVSIDVIWIKTSPNCPGIYGKQQTTKKLRASAWRIALSPQFPSLY